MSSIYTNKSLNATNRPTQPTTSSGGGGGVHTDDQTSPPLSVKSVTPTQKKSDAESTKIRIISKDSLPPKPIISRSSSSNSMPAQQTMYMNKMGNTTNANASNTR